MYFKVTPHSNVLNNLDWSSMVSINFSTPVSLAYSYSNGELIVTVDYTSSIEGE
jgi:hypothetical protein